MLRQDRQCIELAVGVAGKIHGVSYFLTLPPQPDNNIDDYDGNVKECCVAEFDTTPCNPCQSLGVTDTLSFWRPPHLDNAVNVRFVLLQSTCFLQTVEMCSKTQRFENLRSFQLFVVTREHRSNWRSCREQRRQKKVLRDSLQVFG